MPLFILIFGSRCSLWKVIDQLETKRLYSGLYRFSLSPFDNSKTSEVRKYISALSTVLVHSVFSRKSYILVWFGIYDSG